MQKKPKGEEQREIGEVGLTCLVMSYIIRVKSPVTPSPSSLLAPLAGKDPTALISPFISAPCTSCLGLCNTLPIFSLDTLAMYADLRFGVAVTEMGGWFSWNEGASTSAFLTGGAFSLVGEGGAALRPRVEGTRLVEARGSGGSSHPSPPDAIRGKCRPSRRRSVRLMDPYLSFPPEPDPLGSTESPEGTYLDIVEGGVGDGGFRYECDLGVSSAGVKSDADGGENR